MEANELMIGDWVILNYEGVKKAVVTHRLHQHLCDVLTDCGNHIDSVPYSMLEGVPITEEILEANGIKYQFGQPWYQAYNPLTLEGVFEIVYDDMIRLPIRYAHELQHALRLCGLNDLADNFKIE